MKFLFDILCLIISVLVASNCSGNGGHNDNPYTPVANAIKVTCTDNADTVFVNWKINTSKEYDAVEITVPDMNFDETFDSADNLGYITHFPYNKATTIKVKLLNGKNEVGRTEASACIKGFDRITSAKIITNNAGSITSGDGMYSVALPDGRSIFLMGDSYNSAVTPGGTHSTSSHMFRNSYLVYDPATETATGIVDALGKGTNSSAAVVPGYPNEDKWYWPGDGFVIGDNLYIFQSVMYTGAEGAWGFRYQDSHLLQYSLPDITLVKDEEIAYKPLGAETYGSAALYDNGYVYIYQQCDMDSEWVPLTYAYAARAKEEDLWGTWEFWDGSDWTTDQSKMACMKGADQVCIASQFNVKKIRDKYVLFTENKSLLVSEVYTMTSDTPVGPWGNKKTIYTIPELDSSDWYTYNAMIHPQFEKDGMILFTIDVNTSNFSEQASNVASYRPLFIWMDIDEILN